MPPAAAHLNSLIPSPMYFHGPFVGVDKLMDIFKRLSLPEYAPEPSGEGADPNQFDLAKSVHYVMNADLAGDETGSHLRDFSGFNNRNNRRGFKRKGPHMGNHQFSHNNSSQHFRGHNPNHHHHESEDEDMTPAPPPNDVFRNRQQKRVKA